MTSFTARLSQTLGIPEADVPFFAQAAREHAGQVLKYKQILHNVKHGVWTRDDLNRIAILAEKLKSTNRAQQTRANTIGIELLDTGEKQKSVDKTEQAIAKTLGIELSKALDFIKKVRARFLQSLSTEEILEGIQALDKNKRTIFHVTKALEVIIIARELGIEKTSSQYLAKEISELLGRPITNQHILKAAWASTPTPTVDTVLKLLEDETKLILEIAIELGEEPKEARAFVNYLRTSFPWATHQDVLQAIRSLNQSERTVGKISDSLDLLLISRELGIERSEAQELAYRIEQMTGYPITNAKIVNYILSGDKKTNRSIEELLVVCHVAHTKNMFISAAKRFVEEMRHKVHPPASYQDFLSVFVATDAPRTGDQVAARLRKAQVMWQLQIDLDELMAEVRKSIGIEISEARVFEVLTSLKNRVTVEGVIKHFEEEYASTLYIAHEMGLNAMEVQAMLNQIARSYRRNVTEEDVVQALKNLDTWPKTMEKVVEELRYNQIAQELCLSPQKARELVSELKQIIGFPIDNDLISQTLAAMKDSSKNKATLLAMLQVTRILNLNVQQVDDLLKRIRLHSTQAISIEDLWRILIDIELPNRNSDGIVTFISIIQQLKTPITDMAVVNKTVFQLQRNNQLKSRFGYLLTQFAIASDVGTQDLNYLLELSAYPDRSIQFLSPNTNKEERWITHELVLDLLARLVPENSFFSRAVRRITERQRQVKIKLLQDYSQKCWQTICSNSRRYQVPSQGHAEIIASNDLVSTIDLRSVRFIQEGIRAPGVFVQFRFGEPSTIGVVSINIDGVFSGFYQLSDDLWFQELIKAIAVAYYRDLVIPGKMYLPKAPRPKHRQRREASLSSNTMRHRRIPTPRTLKRYSLEDWYESQEIARHLVRGHPRWVGDYYVAPPEKQQQA